MASFLANRQTMFLSRPIRFDPRNDLNKAELEQSSENPFGSTEKKLEKLPIDLQKSIASYLDSNSLKASRFVCKTWNKDFISLEFRHRMISVLDFSKTYPLADIKLGVHFFLGHRVIPTAAFRFIYPLKQTSFLWITAFSFANVTELQLKDVPLYAHQFHFIFYKLQSISKLALTGHTKIIDFEQIETSGKTHLMKDQYSLPAIANIKNSLQHLRIGLNGDNSSESVLCLLNSMTNETQLGSLQFTDAKRVSNFDLYSNRFDTEDFGHHLNGFHKLYHQLGKLIQRNCATLQSLDLDLSAKDGNKTFDIFSRLMQLQDWSSCNWVLRKLSLGFGLTPFNNNAVPHFRTTFKPFLHSLTLLDSLSLANFIVPPEQEDEFLQLLPPNHGIDCHLRCIQSINFGIQDPGAVAVDGAGEEGDEDENDEEEEDDEDEQDAIANPNPNPNNAPAVAGPALNLPQLILENHRALIQNLNCGKKSTLGITFNMYQNNSADNSIDTITKSITWESKSVEWLGPNTIQASIIGRNLANMTIININQDDLPNTFKVLIGNDHLQLFIREGVGLIKLVLHGCNLSQLSDSGLTGLSEDVVARMIAEENYELLQHDNGERAGLPISTLQNLKTLKLLNGVGNLERITDVTYYHGLSSGMLSQMKELSWSQASFTYETRVRIRELTTKQNHKFKLDFGYLALALRSPSD